MYKRQTGIGALALDLGVAEGVGRDLIEVDHGFEVLAVAAGVGEAYADGVAQVLFEGQVPLLDGGVAVVDGEGVVEVGGSRGAAGLRVEWVGEGEQRRDSIAFVVLIVGGQIAGMDLSLIHI